MDDCLAACFQGHLIQINPNSETDHDPNKPTLNLTLLTIKVASVEFDSLWALRPTEPQYIRLFGKVTPSPSPSTC